MNSTMETKHTVDSFLGCKKCLNYKKIDALKIGNYLPESPIGLGRAR